MDAITEFGSGLLTFIQGLPSPVWTAVGVAIGVMGTMLVERGKRKSDMAKEARTRQRELADRLEARQRGEYVEVLSLARDLATNSNAEKVALAHDTPVPKATQLEAVKTLNRKLTSMTNATYNASLDSDTAMREILSDLRTAASYFVASMVYERSEGEVLDSKQFGPNVKSMPDAIDSLNYAVHKMFAPDMKPGGDSAPGDSGSIGSES